MDYSACVPVLQQRLASSILLPFAETTVLANDLKKDDFKVVSLHPGFVATDMGASASDLMSAIRPGQLAHLPLLHGTYVIFTSQPSLPSCCSSPAFACIAVAHASGSHSQGSKVAKLLYIHRGPGYIAPDAAVGTQCVSCAYGNTQSQRGIGACRTWSNSNDWAKCSGHDEADYDSDTYTNW